MADTKEERERRWWDRWWENDFSWDHLDERTRAFLAADEAELIAGPGGKRYHKAHVPLRWPEGFQWTEANRPKGEWTWEEHDAIAQDLAERIATAFERDKVAAMEGVVLNHVPDVPGPRTVGDTKIGASVDLSYSWLEISRSWRGSVVGDAIFSEAYFSGLAHFGVMLFSGKAYFRRAHFSEVARFKETHFASQAWFEETTFSENARFGDASFGKHVSFDGAQFFGNAEFFYTHFSEDVLFNKVRFFEHAYFPEAHFSGYAHFGYARFSRNALFRDTLFAGNADFGRSLFAGDTSFSEALFTGDVDFERVLFAGDAGFDGARFPAKPDDYAKGFFNAQFEGLLNLEGPDFRAFAAFDGAILKSEVRLSHDVVRDNKRLQEAVDVIVSPQTYRQALDDEKAKKRERHAEETREAQLTTRQSLGEPNPHIVRRPHDWEAIPPHTSFESDNRRPRDPIVLYRGYDNGKPTMSRAERADFKDKYAKKQQENLRSLENGARVLKLALERARDRLGEQQLYRLELLARQRQKTTSKAFKSLTSAYGLTANYGASMAQPIGSIGVVSVTLAAVYFGLALLAAPGSSASGSMFIDALSFSAQNVFRPFSVWSVNPDPESFQAKLLFGLEHKWIPWPWVSTAWAFVIRLVATLQSFFSIVMLFLTGLAARRYFQLS